MSIATIQSQITNAQLYIPIKVAAKDIQIKFFAFTSNHFSLCSLSFTNRFFITSNITAIINIIFNNTGSIWTNICAHTTEPID
jgi:hypothetical protein